MRTMFYSILIVLLFVMLTVFCFRIAIKLLAAFIIYLPAILLLLLVWFLFFY